MNIYWDLNEHNLVTSLTNSQQIQRLEWFLRDQVPVTLYLVTADDTTQVYTQQEAPSGWSVKFTIKHSSGLSGNALVFSGTWVLSGSGATATYGATIDLNTAELIAAHAAGENSSNEYDLIAEFTLQDANGNHRDTTQLACRITEDVLRGTESGPTASETPWPNFQWYNDPATGRQCLRIVNDDGETLAELKPAGV